MRGDCIWAPVTHVAPAIVTLVFERPCGHHRQVSPSCAEHDKPVGNAALRPTPCPVCGVLNRPTVVERT